MSYSLINFENFHFLAFITFAGSLCFGQRLLHTGSSYAYVAPFRVNFSLGGKLLSQKSSFVCKHDSARKLNGFLLLSDVAFPQANQIAGKGRCERNIPPNGNQA